MGSSMTARQAFRPLIRQLTIALGLDIQAKAIMRRLCSAIHVDEKEYEVYQDGAGIVVTDNGDRVWCELRFRDWLMSGKTKNGFMLLFDCANTSGITNRGVIEVAGMDDSDFSSAAKAFLAQVFKSAGR